jgi:hypothetical protein
MTAGMAAAKADRGARRLEVLGTDGTVFAKD